MTRQSCSLMCRGEGDPGAEVQYQHAGVGVEGSRDTRIADRYCIRKDNQVDKRVFQYNQVSALVDLEEEGLAHCRRTE